MFRNICFLLIHMSLSSIPGLSQHETRLPSEILENAILETERLIDEGSLSASKFYQHTNELIKKRVGAIHLEMLSREECLTYTNLLERMDRRDESLPILQNLIDDEDVIAQKALAKMAEIFAIKKMMPEAEQTIKDYKRRFKPTPEFPNDLSDAIRIMASRYRRAGEKIKSCGFLLEELSRMPTNAPYNIYYQPSSSWKFFSDATQKQALTELLKNKSKALQDTLSTTKTESKEKLRRFKKLIKSMENTLRQMNIIGHPAPEIPFTNFFNSSSFTIGSLKGKVVLLDFWGHWCSPCIGAFPGLAEIHQAFRNEAFELIGVTSLYGMTTTQLESYLKKHQITWPTAISDESAHQISAYGVNGLPLYVLLDKAGNIHSLEIGTSDEVLARLRAAIEALVKE